MQPFFRWTATLLLTLALVNCGPPPTPSGPFKVGGNVSGMGTGKSLTLRNNGGDDVTLTVNGDFTFPTLVPAGGNYNITVLTQPAGQTCTVYNPTGTNMMSDAFSDITCRDNTPTRYTVGGTVSGLAGGQTVVLTNNGGDDLTVTGVASGSVTFTFATGLASGATYSVASKSALCTVANGGGTIGSANVTNVTVSCMSNSYFLGGTVSGLSAGDTLVLANGADSLTLTTNGTFTFSTRVAQGASYNVTVTSSPAGKTCTVSNGSGTMGSAHVSNVTVTCGVSGQTYRVGIYVGGLGIGRSLTVRNNGGDDLTVTQEGDYFFSTPLPMGSAYNVTVFAQPAGLTCTPVSPSGTNSTMTVVVVDVLCS